MKLTLLLLDRLVGHVLLFCVTLQSAAVLLLSFVIVVSSFCRGCVGRFLNFKTFGRRPFVTLLEPGTSRASRKKKNEFPFLFERRLDQVYPWQKKSAFTTPPTSQIGQRISLWMVAGECEWESSIDSSQSFWQLLDLVLTICRCQSWVSEIALQTWK